MRPWAVLAVCLAVVLLIPASSRLAAQEEDSDASLPLEKVVMFSSGVGFYQHAGAVEGDSQVQFRFNVDDINDLLKSMVLQDLGGGKISTVNYGSKDPITKTLKTFAIDLTSNPTLADLLGQVRGEKVAVQAPTEITGTILGVEYREKKVGENETIKVAILNLLTDAGLRSIPLDSVTSIKLLDEKLNAELRQALMVLAMGKSTDKKTVTLNFVGQGKRDVRVGYIQESPIWKTSYRLVLADDEKPYLQGWAIVENTTEEDWKNVDLTLVSGRPISFIMDLYQPLYVPRPLVEPELFASLRPQTYGQDLANKDADFRRLAGRNSNEQMEKAKQLTDQLARKRYRGEGKGEGGGGYAAPQESADRAKSDARWDLQQGAQSMAQAGEVGELFQYQIETPVSLPRQQSAMLPIVNGNVEADKVSIYNQNVHAKHPLSGLQMVNSTGLHLMQGPITVFDDGVYAGDAQIQDLPPGTKRLVSYAMDLDTEVAPESTSHPEELVSARLNRGVLYATRKYRRSHDYLVKNSGRRVKQVLIEQRKDATWKLVDPEKPEDVTRDVYRFAVEAKPGEPAKLHVAEEYTASQSIVLTNTPDSTILYYIRAKVVSDKVKEALREVIRRKEEIAELASQRRRLEQQLKVIDQEQARIRQNMGQLDRNTELYARYVKKFTEQEDQVENLRAQIQDLTEQEAAKQKSLNEYLTDLTLE